MKCCEGDLHWVSNSLTYTQISKQFNSYKRINLKTGSHTCYAHQFDNKAHQITNIL